MTIAPLDPIPIPASPSRVQVPAAGLAEAFRDQAQPEPRNDHMGNEELGMDD